ncbi:MAG: sensor domain-containing diguanylate cyclase [Treponema sp.]|nr:sensor domain-containing diguanylate cyclase [Treponema sp.]
MNLNEKSSSKKAQKAQKAISFQQYEKELYDLKQMLEVSKSLCSVLEYNTLVESILYVCLAQMHVLGAGMFVLKSFDSDVFALDSNYNGLTPDDDINYTIPANHPIICFFNEKNLAFTIDELRSEMKDADIPEQITSLEPTLIAPLKHKNHINGILLLGERIDLGDGIDFSEYDRQQVLSIAALSSIAINNATLVEMTTTDMMTHLKLKHYFYNVLAEKLDFSILNEMPISVMMLDVDFFKKFNDTYGHSCGDFVLKKVAQTIFEGIRDQDMAGRYGGEEFVVMLYNTDSKAAALVAERIRKTIENETLVYEGNKMHLTISIGVSEYNPEKRPLSAKNLVDLADQALYVSKNNGRNRVTVANEEMLNSLQKESEAS